jgi:hypothetical protein
MSIYVGDKKAVLLKSDGSVVEFYKGDKKLFGYDGEAVGAPLVIGDVHPAEHNVGVKLSSDTVADFSGVEVARYGKNLLHLEGREVVNFGHYLNTATRTFPGGNGIILRFSPNNYYMGGAVTDDFEIGNGRISYPIRQNWYGIGLDIKLRPNTKYIFSFADRVGGITLTEYDADGNYLGNRGLTAGAITTQSNTDWGVICFRDDGGVTVSATNIQFEFGEVATEYESGENIEPVTYTANADGTVEGVKSISPSMSLIPNNESVVLECEYCKA